MSNPRNNLIQIKDVLVQRNQDGCPHKNLSVDAALQAVTCKDCGEELNPIEALVIYAENVSQYYHYAKQSLARINAIKQKKLTLKAALTVQDAWRSRSMVPTCPHCNEAIYPTDGFGGTQINKKIAERRRAEK